MINSFMNSLHNFGFLEKIVIRNLSVYKSRSNERNIFQNSFKLRCNGIGAASESHLDSTESDLCRQNTELVPQL